MERFAQLFSFLEENQGSGDRVTALTTYFREASSADAALALHFFCGRKINRSVTSKDLRTWATEVTGFPSWLIEDCYQSVGDLGETLNLLLSKKSVERPRSLSDLVQRELLPLARLNGELTAARVKVLWREMGSVQRLILFRLLMGHLRLAIPMSVLADAISGFTELPHTVVLRRLSLFVEPSAASYDALLESESSVDKVARPYPFCELALLSEGVESLGHIDQWQIEWIWEGVRVQLIRREGEILLWSGSGEILNGQFPEIEQAASLIDDGVVMDGVIVSWDQERNQVGPFYRLQRRLGRIPEGNNCMIEEPVVFIAFDLIEAEGQDKREVPLMSRRRQLHDLLIGLESRFLELRESNPFMKQRELFGDWSPSGDLDSLVSMPAAIRCSEVIRVSDWEALREQKGRARARGSKGLILKRVRSSYSMGSETNDWFRWEVEPYLIRAVLVAAQPGKGKRREPFVDYTFAVWKGEELTPVARISSGLNEIERIEVDQFVREHTQARHGPVRSVSPELVFSIEFEGVEEAVRSRAGLALRCPKIVSMCRGLPLSEVGQLEALLKLLG